MFADDAVSEVADAVSEFEPDLIGLSIRNLDNQSNLNPVWNLPAVRDIIDRIRQISGAKTLIGGPCVQHHAVGMSRLCGRGSGHRG